MDQLFELYRPQLRDPILLAAFAGWNDAAEAATGAIRFLMRQWNAEPCAEIEPETFFIFTETRPQVRIVEGQQRRITWPQNQFYHARPPGSARDVLFLVGAEPHLKWKTFCRLVLDYAVDCGVDLVVCLGALLADVLHSRPPVLSGSIADPSLARRVARLGLKGSRYEGPTGIVGVLTNACKERSISSGSLWGSVPHYISSMSNPSVTGALVRGVADVFDFRVDLSELERSAVRFNNQVARAIADDADVAAYVKQLEEREGSAGEPRLAELPPPADLPSADVLIGELEEFFKRGGKPPSDE
jgi:proteasome assembly chaperone (PAC2) family protein